MLRAAECPRPAVSMGRSLRPGKILVANLRRVEQDCCGLLSSTDSTAANLARKMTVNGGTFSEAAPFHRAAAR